MGPRAAGTLSVAIMVALFAGALLGADVLDIGQSPARAPHGERYAARRPLPDLCAVMTADRLAVALTPASTEHDEQDRDTTGCHWESRRHGDDIPADLRIEVERPDAVVSAGGSAAAEAGDDYRNEITGSPGGPFVPVRGVGREAAVATRRDPDLGDDVRLVTRDDLLVVRIEYERGPGRSTEEQTSMLVGLARTVLTLMPPGGR